MNKGLITRIGEAIDQQRQEPQSRSAQAVDAPRPSRLPALARWFLPNGGTLLLIAILIFTQNVWASPAQLDSRERSQHRNYRLPGPSGR